MSFEKEIKYFVYTGGIWSLYNALTSTFLSLFALSLGASNLVIGLIGSIPYIGALLAELPGAKLLDYFSRKSLIMFSTAIRILWVVIAVAPILLKENVLLTIIITYFLLCLLDYVSDPAWFSFLGDIVPEKTRGSYFGKRLMLMGVLGALGQVIGGQFLMLFPTIQGFSGMFLMGAIIGVSSFILYLHVEEPKYEDSQHHKLKDFFIMDKKVRKFSIFVAVFNFGYMLAAPFFSIFMIKTLGISYAWFGVLTALQIITKLLAQRHMGKICDLYGDKPVAVITSFGTALIPLAFLLALKFGAWFVIPAQLLSGLVWAGWDIVVVNLLLDLTDSKKRAVVSAEFQTMQSIPLIIAPVIGGYIADSVVLVLSGIPLVFAISCVFRSLSPLFILGLKEPRAKHEYGIFYVLKRTISIHPMDEVHYLTHVTALELKEMIALPLKLVKKK